MNREPRFRLAKPADLPAIMAILEDAKEVLKARGVKQWQDGYPDAEVIGADLQAGQGYAIEWNDEICGYLAICMNGDPAYATIAGAWLTARNNYGVIHRLAVKSSARGLGFGRSAIEFGQKVMREGGKSSSRIDTDASNNAMRHLLQSLGYSYCGKIKIMGTDKLGFEKVFNNSCAN